MATYLQAESRLRHDPVLLITNDPRDPNLCLLPYLKHDLRTDGSLTGVDIICSYIRKSGVEALAQVFDQLYYHQIPVRVLTTTMMGISEPKAIRKLAEYNNVQVKVVLHQENADSRTTFHTKGWRFHRSSTTDFQSGSAIIGSSNMSYSALTTGVEWNIRILNVASNQSMLYTFDQAFNELWNESHPNLIPRAFTSSDTDFAELELDSKSARCSFGGCDCDDCQKHQRLAKQKTATRRTRQTNRIDSSSTAMAHGGDTSHVSRPGPPQIAPDPMHDIGYILGWSRVNSSQGINGIIKAYMDSYVAIPPEKDSKRHTADKQAVVDCLFSAELLDPPKRCWRAAHGAAMIALARLVTMDGADTVKRFRQSASESILSSLIHHCSLASDPLERALWRQELTMLAVVTALHLGYNPRTLIYDTQWSYWINLWKGSRAKEDRYLWHWVGNFPRSSLDYSGLLLDPDFVEPFREQILLDLDPPRNIYRAAEILSTPSFFLPYSENLQLMRLSGDFRDSHLEQVVLKEPRLLMDEPKNPYFDESMIVNCLIFSSDGSRLAASTENGVVRMWETSGTELGDFQGFSGRCALAMEDHFNLLQATVCRSKDSSEPSKVFLMRMNIESGRKWTMDGSWKEDPEISVHQNGSFVVALSPNLKRVAWYESMIPVVDGSGVIRICDLGSGGSWVLEENRSPLASMAFSPSADRLMAYRVDRVIQTYDLSSKRCIDVEKRLTEWSSAAFCFHDDRLHTVLSSFEGNFRFSEEDSSHPPTLLQASREPFRVIAFVMFNDATEHYRETGALAAATDEGRIKLWWIDNTTGHLPRTSTGV